jgi:hypothetical protein
MRKGVLDAEMHTHERLAQQMQQLVQAVERVGACIVQKAHPQLDEKAALKYIYMV